MEASKKESTYLTTPFEKTVYLENNFSTISSLNSNLESELKSPPKSPLKSQIVTVHGIGTYTGWFDSLIHILADKQIAASALDLPGFGRSGERGTVQSYKEWTNALEQSWNKTQEISKKDTFLLGHSLGGVVSLASLKNLYPKPKGVILVVPGLMANSKSWGLFDFVLPTFIKGLQNSPEKISFPFPKEVYDSVQKGTHKLEMLTPEVKPKLFLEILKMANQAWSAVNQFKDIPLYMVLSEEDDTCYSPASKLFFNLCNSKNKQLKVFKKTNHDLFILPEADELCNLIGDWVLDRVGKTID